jgi:hypothetical protein
MGEDDTKQQKRWRIIKEIVIYPGGCGALFGGVMRGSVVGELRHPVIGQASRRVEADKICARGFPERDDQAVSTGGHEQKDRNLDGEQYRAVKTDALAS